jgi:hypothetical protein
LDWDRIAINTALIQNHRPEKVRRGRRTVEALSKLSLDGFFVVSNLPSHAVPEATHTAILVANQLFMVLVAPATYVL